MAATKRSERGDRPASSDAMETTTMNPKPHRIPHALAIVAAALAAVVALPACSTAPVLGRDTARATAPEKEMGGPLSGEALAQRKIEMRRASRDLVHFGATVETMRLRRDRDRDDFQDFMDRFLGDRVDPLLVGTDSSDDPELAVLDAELRLVKAELLIETKDFWQAGDVIDTVEDRYGERRSMLVRFPVGKQSTIAESIEYLRERNKGAAGSWSASPSGS